MPQMISDASEVNEAFDEISMGLNSLSKIPKNLRVLLFDLRESLRLRRSSDFFKKPTFTTTETGDLIVRLRIGGKLKTLRTALRACKGKLEPSDIKKIIQKQSSDQ